MEKQIRIQPKLDSEVHKKLEAMAKENGAKVSPYAASVLTKHVTKQQGKPVTKHEFSDTPNAIWKGKFDEHPKKD